MFGWRQAGRLGLGKDETSRLVPSEPGLLFSAPQNLEGASDTGLSRDGPHDLAGRLEAQCRIFPPSQFLKTSSPGPGA